MARVNVEGERAVLALIADLYAQVIDLREALDAERAAHEATRQQLPPAPLA